MTLSARPRGAIQLGAILPSCRSTSETVGDRRRRAEQDAPRRFIIGVLIASCPPRSSALCCLLHQGRVFNVWIVCTMLIVGGGVLLWVDRLRLKPVLMTRRRSR